jgi:hypothetical protein
LIAVESEDEAHYIAALLNSAPSVAALYFSSTGVQTQRYHASDAEKIGIPRFTGAEKQVELSQLSRRCHNAMRKEQSNELNGVEEELDKAAASFWGISSKELKEIRRTLQAVNKASEFAHASFPAQVEDE